MDGPQNVLFWGSVQTTELIIWCGRKCESTNSSNTSTFCTLFVPIWFLAALAALYLTLYTYNRREPTYNHGEPTYNHGEPTYNHGEPTYNHREPTYNHREPTYNRGEPLTATLDIEDEWIYDTTLIPLTIMTPTIMTTLIPLTQTTQNDKNPHNQLNLLNLNTLEHFTLTLTMTSTLTMIKGSKLWCQGSFALLRCSYCSVVSNTNLV